jgi:hypothetical protein
MVGMKKFMLAALFGIAAFPAFAGEGLFDGFHDPIPTDPYAPPRNEVQHYCEVTKGSDSPEFNRCMAYTKYPELQAWKAERQRAARYRDPTSASLCLSPYRMTRDGCQR